jgi:hypothetical protein
MMRKSRAVENHIGLDNFDGPSKRLRIEKISRDDVWAPSQWSTLASEAHHMKITLESERCVSTKKTSDTRH